jgi:hypothetical protein
MRPLLLIAALLSSLYSMEPIASPDLDSTCRIICDGFVHEKWTELDAVIHKHWYQPNPGTPILTMMRDQFAGQSQQILSAHGMPIDGISLIGYKNIGELFSLYYFKNYSGVQLPIKILFVKRKDGFYLCGIVYGLNIVQELDAFMGKYPGETPK